jgi:pteridine reductase
MTSPGSLAGKTALVTGSARRLGAEIVRTLHAAGASIVIHYRSSADDAEELCRALNSKRAQSAVTVQGNLADTATIAPLMERVVDAFGRLDVLVNNASTFFPTPVGEITESEWQDLVGSNLKGPLFLSQEAAPHLAKHEGLIVNMVDIHALRPLRHHTVYSIAKAGLIMLTRSLARELGPRVRVNAIAPGPVLWPEAGIDEEHKKDIIERTALERPGTPEDIARAVLFFAADAPYVTGQVLVVDGGRSIGW